MNTKGQMALFAFLAYYDFYNPKIESLQDNVKNILLSVKDDLEFSEVSWGPVAYKSHEIFSDSLIYVVKNNRESTTPEYTIVIRGTNPFSISSWIYQDLDVSGLTPWSRQSENTESKFAYISKATDTSLSIHKSLSCNGQNILAWILGLLEKSPVKLNITGHSLGGLMSTTFGLWLYDELVYKKAIDKVDMSIYSFAGPTAGNAEYAKYIQEKMSTGYTCIENYKDIATHVWYENDMVNILPDIYDTIKPGKYELQILNNLIAEIHKLEYAKIGNIEEIHSKIYDHGIFKDYLVQAVYQHVIPYLIYAFLHAPKKSIDIIIAIIKELIFGIEEWVVEGKNIKLDIIEKEKMFEEIKMELLSHIIEL